MSTRTPFVRVIIAAACFLGTLVSVHPAWATVRYRISLAQNSRHVFKVGMDIPNVTDRMEIAMPVWNALYQVRDFSYRIQKLEVAVSGLPGPSGGSPARLRPVDKKTWQILLPDLPTGRGRQNRVTVSYWIEWNDPGPFNSQLDAHHAFINFAEVLLYLPSRRREGSQITLGDVPADWKIACALAAGPEPNSFTAESYDALADAPLEAGGFSDSAFDIEGVHFRVVVDGMGWEENLIEDFLRPLTSYESRLMNGAPFKEYTFFFHVGSYAEVGGGGMEHANCTAISAASIESAASIAAHEFFHSWNVKRIRPQSLEPVDYSKEQPTDALWFAEGVTSTYAAYALERTGLWTKERFYDDLAAQISELESRPAQQWQSVEQSSLDAWLERYDTYNAPDHSISYYNKGQILGEFIDLSLRDSTDNRKSLDDVLRTMNQEYARAGKFYDDSEGVRQAVEEVGNGNYRDFFRRFVAGTDPLPYNDLLAVAGLSLKIDVTTRIDLGFWPATDSRKNITVTDLEPGSAAEAAGLRNSDLIVSSHGKSAPQDMAQWLRGRSVGDLIAVRIRRGAQEMEVSFLLGSQQDRRYSIVELPVPSEKQRRIRAGWLRGGTDQ